MPYPPDEEEDLPPEPCGDGLEPLCEWPTLEVEITEPTEVGRLLGPDGEPLLVMYDRSTVPFGFQVPG